jgi:hypothetical protein
MIEIWTYRRGAEAQRDDVADWLEALDETNKAEVLGILFDLLHTPKSKWGRPDYGELSHKEWAGFAEIIFKLKPSKVQIRLVGYWRTDEQFAVVLLHNKNESGPLTSHESKLAKTRKQQIEDDPSRIGVWIDEEAFR